MAKLVKCAVDTNGKLVGRFDENSVLNTLLYNV